VNGGAAGNAPASPLASPPSPGGSSSPPSSPSVATAGGSGEEEGDLQQRLMSVYNEYDLESLLRTSDERTADRDSSLRRDSEGGGGGGGNSALGAGGSGRGGLTPPAESPRLESRHSGLYALKLSGNNRTHTVRNPLLPLTVQHQTTRYSLRSMCCVLQTSMRRSIWRRCAVWKTAAPASLISQPLSTQR
jgi:hypothetical protein